MSFSNTFGSQFSDLFWHESLKKQYCELDDETSIENARLRGVEEANLLHPPGSCEILKADLKPSKTTQYNCNVVSNITE